MWIIQESIMLTGGGEVARWPSTPEALYSSLVLSPENLVVRKVLCLACGDGYTCVHSFLNSSKCTCKMGRLGTGTSTNCQVTEENEARGFLFLFVILFVETGSHYEALVVLKLTM